MKANKPKIELATPVQQQHKDDCDINVIAKRYDAGQQPNLNNHPPMYTDQSSMPTYHEMLNIVRNHEQQFAKLPAEIRREFNNKPEEMVTFLSNSENKEKAIEMGFNPEFFPEEEIAPKEEDKKPPPVEKEKEPTK